MSITRTRQDLPTADLRYLYLALEGAASWTGHVPLHPGASNELSEELGWDLEKLRAELLALRGLGYLAISQSGVELLGGKDGPIEKRPVEEVARAVATPPSKSPVSIVWAEHLDAFEASGYPGDPPTLTTRRTELIQAAIGTFGLSKVALAARGIFLSDWHLSNSMCNPESAFKESNVERLAQLVADAARETA